MILHKIFIGDEYKKSVVPIEKYPTTSILSVMRINARYNAHVPITIKKVFKTESHKYRFDSIIKYINIRIKDIIPEIINDACIIALCNILPYMYHIRQFM